jgi:lambda repressor-like predicted transcriptional regulator
MSNAATPLDETRVIRGLIAETGTPRAVIATALDLSTETLRRRLKAPGSFTLGELDIVANTLGTTTEEILRRRQSVA